MMIVQLCTIIIAGHAITPSQRSFCNQLRSLVTGTVSVPVVLSLEAFQLELLESDSPECSAAAAAPAATRVTQAQWQGALRLTAVPVPSDSAQIKVMARSYREESGLSESW